MTSPPPPATLPGTTPVSARHIVTVIWPRTVWLIRHTSLRWLLVAVITIFGMLHWWFIDRSSPPSWRTVTVAAAAPTLLLLAAPWFQFNVIRATRGPASYAIVGAVIAARPGPSRAGPHPPGRPDRAGDWWIGEHFTWPPGTAQGSALRALVFPQLAAAALAVNVELIAEVASPRVRDIYETEGWLVGALIEPVTAAWWRPSRHRWVIRWPADALRTMSSHTR